jgi:YycE-like C-terminal domain
VDHRPDEDDLIVFYLNSKEELNTIKKNIENSGIPLIKSKNPYWQKNGIEIKDPDGYGIILTISP